MPRSGAERWTTSYLGISVPNTVAGYAELLGWVLGFGAPVAGRSDGLAGPVSRD